MSLNRFASFNMSLRGKPSASTPDLRPCQRVYLGESNARRLLKRSQISKKARRDPPPPSSTDTEEQELTDAQQREAALRAAVTADASLPYAPPGASGYIVECYATHAEDALRQREAAVAAMEKRVLLRSINSSRQAEGQQPLRLKVLLSKYAQDYADMIYQEGQQHEAAAIGPGGLRGEYHKATTISNHQSVVVVMAPSGARVARLISPPRIGALTCGEMWYGGKYRRHVFGLDSTSASHPEDCPCHLRMVFETMIDAAWTTIGIGRSEDGRWVVELGQ